MLLMLFILAVAVLLVYALGRVALAALKLAFVLLSVTFRFFRWSW